MLRAELQRFIQFSTIITPRSGTNPQSANNHLNANDNDLHLDLYLSNIAFPHKASA